jgi:integrase
LLSKKIAEVKPRAAMAAKDVPAFMATLGGSVEDRALRFMILTGVRQKEALGARWHGLDHENRVWIVPRERMKMKRDHAVPLTDAMIACLGPAGADDAFVFPSRRTGGMRGHDALTMSEHGVTLHGFRSTLSTWAEEQDDGRAYPRAVIKAVLAHGKGDAVTAAYLRPDLFKARRKLMHGERDNADRRSPLFDRAVLRSAELAGLELVPCNRRYASALPRTASSLPMRSAARVRRW